MRRRTDDRGAAAVEFALVLPLLVALLFFALYGALFFYYSAVADHVARTVAREMSIPTGGAYPDAQAQADADKATGTLMPDPSSVTVTPKPADGAPQTGDLVTVTIDYKLPVLSQLASVIPGLSSIDTLSRTATERRQ
jgi:Flp pilus assembly protein TadG